MITDQIEMSREMELVLCSARPRMDGETTKRISVLLDDPMDWNRVLSIAERHRLMTLLYRNLISAFKDEIPSEILSELQSVYLFNAKRNLLLTRELLRIIDLFEDHGIPTVPFKGPNLGVLAYGDLTLRMFNDLDIMVQKDDVLKATDLLASEGYTPQTEGYRPPKRLTPSQKRALLANQNEYNFVNNDTSMTVEVHWRFHPSVPLEEGAWARLDTAELEGKVVRSFSCEDLVLSLCCHGTKHGWAQLYLVSDLAGMIEGQNIDWDFVNFEAQEMGIRNILHMGLLLAHDLCGGGIPEPIVNGAAGNSRAAKLVFGVSRELLNENEPSQGIVSNCLFWSRTIERPTNRFRYFLSLVTVPTSYDYDLIVLPEPLYPLYRIVRPARIFWDYGVKGACNLLRKTVK